MSRWLAAPPGMASATAFITAEIAAVVPASPTPLTPSGLVVAGLGQALMENVVYDADSGQLVTGSFMDYAMPRADDIPPMKDALYDVPATTNPLGVKGVGEAGTTAAISAVMNAVADAIPGGAGNHLEMPATAQRLWEACRQAKG